MLYYIDETKTTHYSNRSCGISDWSNTTTMHQPTQVQAAGPSGCPDPGQCTCNAASGVMTDHAMQAPFNRINNGCTEDGWF
jgi:hypothetical protein